MGKAATWCSAPAAVLSCFNDFFGTEPGTSIKVSLSNEDRKQIGLKRDIVLEV
jgi:hypothetical protein